MLHTGQYGLSVRVPVYTTSGCMRHNAFAYYSAESVFVVEERKTCSHGMGRHGTRIRAAYMCALSINRSPTTEDSENFERKSEDGT